MKSIEGELNILFFEQKTAYEIGTGDWSSDVCSSDLTEKHWNHPFLNRELLEPSVPKQKIIGTTHFQIGNLWNLQFLNRKALEPPISK